MGIPLTILGSRVKSRSFLAYLVIPTVGTAAIVSALSLTQSTRSETVPTELFEAQGKIAASNKLIVEIASAVNGKVAEANTADLAGEKDKAVKLIDEAHALNLNARETAAAIPPLIQLAAESSQLIKNGPNQRTALTAAAAELNLVGEFVDYTKQLDEFLLALRASVVSGNAAEKKRAEDLLQSTNAGLAKINSLNRAFLDTVKNLENLF